MFKNCNDCGLSKSVSEFYHRSDRSAPEFICKLCRNLRSQKWHLKNRKKIVLRKRRYHALNRTSEAKRDRQWIRDHPYRYWANLVLQRHKQTFEVVITRLELEELAMHSNSCFYCGEILDWSVGTKGRKPKNNSPSIDRLNNSHTVTRNNIVICCFRCNSTKRDRTLKEFVQYCQMIAGRFAEGKPLEEFEEYIHYD